MSILSPLTLIQSTYFTTGGELAMALPGPVSTAMRIATNIHRAWVWKRHVDSISSKENAAAYGAGLFLNNVLLGKGLLGKLASYPAQLALIASTLQECIEEYGKACQIYHQGKLVLQGRVFYVKHHVNTSNASFATAWMDPASQMWLAVQLQLLIVRIEHLIFYTFRFIVCVFELSNKMIALGEATSIDPNVQDEAKNKFFLSSYKVIKGLSENKDELNKQLKQNKELIKAFLSQTGNDKEAENVIKYIDSLAMGAQALEVVATPTLQSVANGFAQGMMNQATVLIPGSLFGYLLNFFPSQQGQFTEQPIQPTITSIADPLFTLVDSVYTAPITLQEIEAQARKALESSQCAHSCSLEGRHFQQWPVSIET
jgi:hypothetical protein